MSVLKPGTTSFDLRSTDWTLPSGHSLDTGDGTTLPGDRAPWLDIYRLGFKEKLAIGTPTFTLPMGDR